MTAENKTRMTILRRVLYLGSSLYLQERFEEKENRLKKGMIICENEDCVQAMLCILFYF